MAQCVRDAAARWCAIRIKCALGARERVTRDGTSAEGSPNEMPAGGFQKHFSPVLAKALLLLALALSFHVRAVCGSTVSDSPEQIKQLLLQARSSRGASSLARRFGLLIPMARVHGAKSDLPCTAYDAVTVHRTSLSPSQSHAVVQVDSSPCWLSFFIVLEESKPDSWRYIQTIIAGAKYTTPHVSFESLVAPDEKEVIVQDNQVDGGTGILVEDMTIWRLYGDKLHVVFDEPSKVNFAIPLGSSPPYNTDQSETSEFTFVDSSSPAKVGALVNSDRPRNVKRIVQKQVIGDHKKTITRWWIYLWNPAIRRFAKQPWYPGAL